jgi:hypothetical protein
LITNFLLSGFPQGCLVSCHLSAFHGLRHGFLQLSLEGVRLLLFRKSVPLLNCPHCGLLSKICPCKLVHNSYKAYTALLVLAPPFPPAIVNMLCMCFMAEGVSMFTSFKRSPRIFFQPIFKINPEPNIEDCSPQFAFTALQTQFDL